MKPQDLYHAGIVVDDFDGTIEWFTETFGYRFCEPFKGDQQVVTPEGEITVPMQITYSIDEPRIELLASVPGTLWEPSDSGIHHLGYWSVDVDADVATLVASGMALEATAPMPDGRSLWAYCNAPGRTRTEVVSRELWALMSGWLTTGRFDG